MKRILLILLAITTLSSEAHAGVCLPFTVAEVKKYFGEEADYRLIDKNLGNKGGYYMSTVDKYLKRKKVKEVTEFPVIVEYQNHVFLIIGEIGDYYRVKDTMCLNKDRYCLYKKSKIDKKKKAYFQVLNIN